jgi:hypothetical protein
MKKIVIIFLFCIFGYINESQSQNEVRVDRLQMLIDLDYSLGDPVQIGEYNGQPLYRTSYYAGGRAKKPGKIFCIRNAGCCNGGSANHLQDGTILDVRVNGESGQLFKGVDEEDGGVYDVFYNCRGCE